MVSLLAGAKSVVVGGSAEGVVPAATTEGLGSLIFGGLGGGGGHSGNANSSIKPFAGEGTRGMDGSVGLGLGAWSVGITGICLSLVMI